MAVLADFSGCDGVTDQIAFVFGAEFTERNA